MPIRCVIIDDSASFLEVACELLRQEGLDVVGVASSGSETIRQVRELRPDVVLLDIVLGEESGFDVARALHADSAPGKVILISTRAEEDFAELIAQCPAAGFVPKSELSAEAIRRVLER